MLNVARLSVALGKPGVFLWDARAVDGASLHGYTEPLSEFLSFPFMEDAWEAPASGGGAEVNFNLAAMALLPGESAAEVSAVMRAIALDDLRWGGSRPLRHLIAARPQSAGIHIRQGDAASLRWLGGRYWPASFWQAVVRRAIESEEASVHRIFVASDSDAMLESLHQKYPDAIESRFTVPIESTSKLERDLLELLWLSGSAKIIGLKGSLYGTFASLLSGERLVSAGDYLGLEEFLADVRDLVFATYVDDVSVLMSGTASPEATARIKGNVKAMQRFTSRHAHPPSPPATDR